MAVNYTQYKIKITFKEDVSFSHLPRFGYREGTVLTGTVIWQNDEWFKFIDDTFDEQVLTIEKSMVRGELINDNEVLA